MNDTTAHASSTLMEAGSAARAPGEKATVRKVYEEIAAAYDERIPGVTLIDEKFAETERDFVLSRIGPSDDVLDMGCGTGRFTVPIARKARSVTGLDISPAMLAQARAKVEAHGLRASFREADMEHLPFEDQSFDVVTCLLALMHVPLESRQGVFNEVGRVLKPGGRMIVGVKNSLFEQLCRVDRFAAIDVTDVESKRLIFTQTRSGRDLQAPWYSFSPQDLNRLFSVAGLSPVCLKGNIPLFAWVADSILEDPVTYTIVHQLDTLLGDVPPFNYLGYHVLTEAVKPQQ